MNRFLMIRLIALVSVFPLMHLSAADLWEKSYEKMKQNGFWFPSEVTVCEEEIDSKGSLKDKGCTDFKVNCKESIEHIEVSCVRQPEGEVVVQDVGILNMLHELGLGIPYFVAKESVKISQRNNSLTVKGIPCEGFDFETQKDGKQFAGTVWIDPTSANPKQVDMRLTEDNPIKFDNIEIDHFYRTIELDDSDGIVKAKHMVAEAWVSNRSIFSKKLVVKRYNVSLRNQFKAM